MASIELTNTFIVNAPIEKTFAVMADVNQHPQIFEINQEIQNYHGGPAKQGDTWDAVGKFMGQTTLTHYTLAEYSEPHRLVFDSNSSSGDGASIWDFSEVEGGTQVIQTVKGEAKGFFASLAASLLKGTLAKQMREDHDNFKAIVESS